MIELMCLSLSLLSRSILISDLDWRSYVGIYVSDVFVVRIMVNVQHTPADMHIEDVMAVLWPSCLVGVRKVWKDESGRLATVPGDVVDTDLEVTRRGGVPETLTESGNLLQVPENDWMMRFEVGVVGDACCDSVMTGTNSSQLSLIGVIVRDSSELRFLLF